MIAEERTYTTDERRLLDRACAVREVLTCTAGLSGLSHDAEVSIRLAATRHFDPILDLADSATVARIELEAMDARLDRHARTHLGCTYQTPCVRYRTLQIRRERLLAQWDRAYCALVRGRR